MKKATCSLLYLAAFAAGLFAYTACEVSSTDDPRGVSVEPSSATLSPGQSIVLTAKGGWNYNWSLDKDSIGYLTTKTGPTVTYVAGAAAGLQTITVGTKPIEGSSGTNKTVSGASVAIARITQPGR